MRNIVKSICAVFVCAVVMVSMSGCEKKMEAFDMTLEEFVSLANEKIAFYNPDIEIGPFVEDEEQESLFVFETEALTITVSDSKSLFEVRILLSVNSWETSYEEAYYAIQAFYVAAYAFAEICDEDVNLSEMNASLHLNTETEEDEYDYQYETEQYLYFFSGRSGSEYSEFYEIRSFTMMSFDPTK